MHTDDNVRAPALKQAANIDDAARMKELARLWPEAIDQPIVILHPMLLVSQQPVVERDQLGGEMMRFFDRAHDPHCVRFTFNKALDARNDRRRCRTVSATGIGRDDQNLWRVWIHAIKCQKPDRKGGQLLLTAR